MFGTFEWEREDEKIVYGLVDQPQFFNPAKHQVSSYVAIYQSNITLIAASSNKPPFSLLASFGLLIKEVCDRAYKVCGRDEVLYEIGLDHNLVILYFFLSYYKYIQCIHRPKV